MTATRSLLLVVALSFTARIRKSVSPVLESAMQPFSSEYVDMLRASVVDSSFVHKNSHIGFQFDVLEFLEEKVSRIFLFVSERKTFSWSLIGRWISFSRRNRYWLRNFDKKIIIKSLVRQFKFVHWRYSPGARSPLPECCWLPTFAPERLIWNESFWWNRAFILRFFLISLRRFDFERLVN